MSTEFQGACWRLYLTNQSLLQTFDDYMICIGVATLAGRKSILKLAQRMTSSFCHAVGASSFHTWSKFTSKTGEDIRISSRKNLNDPGEPLGLILSAVSSVWLPVSPNVLFDFLRDETRRSEVKVFDIFRFYINPRYS